MRPVLVLLLLASPLLAAPPEPVPGALVIVGGGKMPEAARDEFVKLAGGPEKAKIVVIPSASASADEPKEAESFLKQWKDAKVESVVLLHTRDRKTADSDEFVKPLADATGIWFSGGDQTRLTKAYAGTKVEAAVKKRLSGGAVAGGTSAGAAVMSDLMIEGGTDEAKTGPGLGFLPGVVVDQHFTQRKREKRLAGVIEKNPERLGIGIDEGTAIVVKGGTATVLGEHSVRFIGRPAGAKDGEPTTVEVKAGGKYDLKERKAVK